jgi:DNA-binding HxlR family transcriptional regulator
VLLVNPMLQSMDDLGKVLHLIMQNSNGDPLVLLFILLGRWWHPLLLLSLRLGQHNLDLLRSSPNTVNGHTLHDKLVLGIGDIS